MKRLTTFIMIFILLFGMVTPTYAANSSKARVNDATKAIKILGKYGFTLSKTNKLGLEKTITKLDASKIIVDLLGVSNEELNAEDYSSSIVDVNKASIKYASYCYMNKWFTETTQNEYEPNKKMNAASIIESILLRLGYHKLDNSYEDPIQEYEYKSKNIYKIATEIGLIKASDYDSKTNLIKADLIILFARALELKTYTTTQTLKYELTLKPKYWSNTKGEGNSNFPGVFMNNTTYIVIDKVKDFQTNMVALNDRLGMWYAYVSYDNWDLWEHSETYMNHLDVHPAQILHNEKTNTYGVKIRTWRHSNTEEWFTTGQINAILETFDFLSGDKEVAYALWSWFDAVNMTGNDNGEDYGFKYISKLKNKDTVEMNNIQIEITYNPKTLENDVYFISN